MKSRTTYQSILIIQAFILLVCLPFIPAAQTIRVTATLDTTEMTIGDQTRLTLEAMAPESYRIIWPEIRDTIIQQIEVIHQSPVDTIREPENPGSLLWRQELVITSFDSGYYAIPPFVFLYKTHEEATGYMAAETEAMLLEVYNPEVDMRGDIRDITEPLRAPVTFAEIWFWLLTGIAVAGIVVLTVYYLQRRKRSQPLVALRRKPLLPAHIIALEELDKLRARKLWQTGKVKQYHTELTEIVRSYIEAKFNIPALEMVTHEIIEAVGKTGMNSETLTKLTQMLGLADLVKFARENPLPDEQERSLNQAIEFVKESIQQVEMEHTLVEIPHTEDIRR